MREKLEVGLIEPEPTRHRLACSLPEASSQLRIVEEALNVLQFTNKGSSRPLAKLLKSAVANADQKAGVNVDKLYIETLTVDGGPTVKRFRPRAMGRATQILKRTSHVTVELEQRS